MGEPVTLGPAEDVADLEMKAFSVGPDYIAVAWIGGELYAFDDTCTHAACSLADGELEGATVVCPCHMGQYGLKSGEVLELFGTGFGPTSPAVAAGVVFQNAVPLSNSVALTIGGAPKECPPEASRDRSSAHSASLHLSGFPSLHWLPN